MNVIIQTLLYQGYHSAFGNCTYVLLLHCMYIYICTASFVIVPLHQCYYSDFCNTGHSSSVVCISPYQERVG